MNDTVTIELTIGEAQILRGLIAGMIRDNPIIKGTPMEACYWKISKGVYSFLEKQSEKI